MVALARAGEEALVEHLGDLRAVVQERGAPLFGIREPVEGRDRGEPFGDLPGAQQGPDDLGVGGAAVQGHGGREFCGVRPAAQHPPGPECREPLLVGFEICEQRGLQHGGQPSGAHDHPRGRSEHRRGEGHPLLSLPIPDPHRRAIVAVGGDVEPAGELGDPPSAHERSALGVREGQSAGQRPGTSPVPEVAPSGVGASLPVLGDVAQQPVGHREGHRVVPEDVDLRDRQRAEGLVDRRHHGLGADLRVPGDGVLEVADEAVEAREGQRRELVAELERARAELPLDPAVEGGQRLRHGEGALEGREQLLLAQVPLVRADLRIGEIGPQRLCGEGLEGLAAALHEGAGPAQEVLAAGAHRVLAARGGRRAGDALGHPRAGDVEEICGGSVPRPAVPLAEDHVAAGPGVGLLDIAGMLLRILGALHGNRIEDVHAEARHILLDAHEDDLVVGIREAVRDGADLGLPRSGLRRPCLHVGAREVRDALGARSLLGLGDEAASGVVEGALQRLGDRGAEVGEQRGDLLRGGRGEPAEGRVAQRLEQVVLELPSGGLADHRLALSQVGGEELGRDLERALLAQAGEVVEARDELGDDPAGARQLREKVARVDDSVVGDRPAERRQQPIVEASGEVAGEAVRGGLERSLDRALLGAGPRVDARRPLLERHVRIDRRAAAHRGAHRLAGGAAEILLHQAGGREEPLLRRTVHRGRARHRRLRAGHRQTDAGELLGAAVLPQLGELLLVAVGAALLAEPVEHMTDGGARDPLRGVLEVAVASH